MVKLIQLNITELMEDSPFIDILRTSPKMVPQIGYRSLQNQGIKKIMHLRSVLLYWDPPCIMGRPIAQRWNELSKTVININCVFLSEY